MSQIRLPVLEICHSGSDEIDILSRSFRLVIKSQRKHSVRIYIDSELNGINTENHLIVDDVEQVDR